MIRVVDVHKRFGDLDVLKGVSFEVQQGNVLSMIGASGSGKSTLLRCINYLEVPTAGDILIDGESLCYRGNGNGDRRPRSPSEVNRIRRELGIVFQQFNLWPHMTVMGNIVEAPIRVRGMSRGEAEVLAETCLARVRLLEKAKEYPARLSGGQQQRVAIARALAMQPKVMLFDEPTSSLDPELVGEVLRVIRALAEEGRTMLLVTHELGFAYHYADRVLFLADGRVHEEGTPDQVLKHPREERTRSFLARFTEFTF